MRYTWVAGYIGWGLGVKGYGLNDTRVQRHIFERTFFVVMRSVGIYIHDGMTESFGCKPGVELQRRFG